MKARNKKTGVVINVFPKELYVPHELVDKIVTEYFKENKQLPRKEE